MSASRARSSLDGQGERPDAPLKPGVLLAALGTALVEDERAATPISRLVASYGLRDVGERGRNRSFNQQIKRMTRGFRRNPPRHFCS